MERTDSSERLLNAACDAERALAILDERLRDSPAREGCIARLNAREAVNILKLEGEIVDLEDLVLHDQEMDVRRPTAALLKAHKILVARQRLSSRIVDLSVATLEALSEGFHPPAQLSGGAVGEADDDPDDDQVSEPDWANDPVLGALMLDRAVVRSDVLAWLERVNGSRQGPALLAAVSAFLAWRELDPLPRSEWLGFVLPGALLRTRKRVSFHLPSLATGIHGLSRLKSLSETAKSIFLLEALKESAMEALKQHDRLILARKILRQKAQGKRASSKLPAFVDLLLKQPIVTIALISKELDVSHQGAYNLLEQAGSTIRELTGRSRYRAWSIL